MIFHSLDSFLMSGRINPEKHFLRLNRQFFVSSASFIFLKNQPYFSPFITHFQHENDFPKNILLESNDGSTLAVMLARACALFLLYAVGSSRIRVCHGSS